MAKKRFHHIVLAVLLLATTGCGEPPPDGATPAPTATTPTATAPAASGDSTPSAGAAIYTQYCIACHGNDGQGRAGMASRSIANAEMLSRPDADLVQLLRDGTTGPGRQMPPWNSTLTDTQLQAVINYLRVAFGPSLLPPN